MLQQNWFYDKKFEKFYEYYDREIYFDTENKLFYLVEENENNSVQITQIDKGKWSIDLYNILMNEYKEWKKPKPKEYYFNTYVDIDIPIVANNIEEARELFNQKYAEKELSIEEMSKVTSSTLYVNDYNFITNKDGNEY